ncbi:MAG: hypothetical protein ABL993_02560 [Vicinamibacterales bacterium]
MPRTNLFVLSAGEVDDWAVGFGRRLASGETLTGTPKVTVHDVESPEAQYAGVTVSSIGRNASTVNETDENGTVLYAHAANEAVEFRVTGADSAVAGRYTLRAECSTTAGRSLVEPVPMRIQGPPET